MEEILKKKKHQYKVILTALLTIKKKKKNIATHLPELGGSMSFNPILSGLNRWKWTQMQDTGREKINNLFNGPGQKTIRSGKGTKGLGKDKKTVRQARIREHGRTLSPATVQEELH